MQFTSLYNRAEGSNAAYLYLVLDDGDLCRSCGHEAGSGGRADDLGNLYVFHHRILQPTLEYRNGSLNLRKSGDFVQEMGTASFNSTKKTIAYSGTRNEGSAMILGGQGSAMAQTRESGSGSYSNTGTSVLIAGTSYAAVYGQMANGIVQNFELLSNPQSGCSEKFVFTVN